MRLTVLGGFLGAGKSTWLRHHLSSGVFDGACVVVNEAAATPIDDLLLSGAGHLEVLAGGCACCARRTELLALMRRLCGEPGSAVERIVIETSGLADPQAIVQAIKDDPILAAAIEIGEVVVLLDARHGLDVLRREPLARRQVAGADCLILTKLDAVDAATTQRLAACLDWLNPMAPRFGAISGAETALPPNDGALAAQPPDCMPDHEGAPLRAAEVTLRGADWSMFSLWLSALLYARGSDIARVKGVIGTPAGRLLVQAVQGAVQAAAILPGPTATGDGTIVVIGRGFAGDDLQRSFERFKTACGA